MNATVNIQDFLTSYPFPQDKNFEEKLSAKKEFLDLKLEKNETIPDEPGDMMKHQKLLGKLMSFYTPYDMMLTNYEPGSGKTCMSVTLVELLRQQQNLQKNSLKTLPYRGAIVLVRGSGLIQNYINELVYRCTAGKYDPGLHETGRPLTETERLIRIRKLVSEFYSFYTFEVFAKNMQQLTDDEIFQRYSRHVIIIDEVHNLHETTASLAVRKPAVTSVRGVVQTYKNILRFLHIVRGHCKTLLMTGTAMRDTADEISNIMNFMLPVDNQMETGEDFFNTYFDENKKLKNVEKLKSLFKGKVSFLKRMVTGIKQEYIGNYKYSKRLKLDPQVASEFQSKHYMQAYRSTEANADVNVYINPRQAALAVFPDGSYGSEGFNKYIEKINTGSFMRYRMTKELRDALYDKDFEVMLQRIKRLSIKYYNTLRECIQARKDGRVVLIYNRSVGGSGLIYFSLLLELFGFVRGYGEETTKESRYVILTHKTTTERQMRHIRDLANKPENHRGEFVQIIMGSRVINEGYSYKHVQYTEGVSPYWNFIASRQAIYRGDRLGSLRYVQQEGEPIQQIRLPAMIPLDANGKPDPESSIELIMYGLCEEKLIYIDQIEKVLQDSSVDRYLTAERNDTNFELPANLQVDDSSYQLYYTDESKILEIQKAVQEIFLKTSSMSIYDVLDRLSKMGPPFQLIRALRNMVLNNVSIYDKDGFQYYLRYYKDILYLLPQMTDNNPELHYYVDSPVLKIVDGEPIELNPTIARVSRLGMAVRIGSAAIRPEQDREYSLHLEHLWQQKLKLMPTNLSRVLSPDATPDEFEEILSKQYSQELRQQILEICLSHPGTSAVKTKVLSLFHNLYSKLPDGRYLTWMTDPPRCNSLPGSGDHLPSRFGVAGWVDCPEYKNTIVKREKDATKNRLEKERIYGVYNTERASFVIVFEGVFKKCESRKQVELQDIASKIGLNIAKSTQRPTICTLLMRWLHARNLLVVLEKDKL